MRTCKIIAIVIGAVATDIEYKRGIMKRIIMMFMIIAIEFIDDSKLLLKYYSGEEWKEVSEIIEL